MIYYEGDNLRYYGRDIRHISWAYRYSYWGYKDGNPRAYLPGRKTEAQVEAKAREILTSNAILEHEMGWREAAKGSQYYELFYLALFTGIRRSELLALQWRDLDFMLGQIYVNRSVHILKGG